MNSTPDALLTLLADPLDANGAHRPELTQLSVLEQLRRALANYLETPGEREMWMRFLLARRSASELIARFSRKETDAPHVHEGHELIREMAKSGGHDHTAQPDDLALAQGFVRKGWPGVLAAMLLVPAWQWPDAPLLMEVPDWLRADYVRWLFTAPQNFSSPGQAEAFGAFTLKRLEELVRWLNRAPNGTEEKKVLGAYASHCSLRPVCQGSEALRRHAELRGQLLGRAMGKRDDHYRAPFKPRAGRRLRIGIINRNFEPQLETYATLPLFEQLDPERFEVMLFTYVSGFSRVEEHCRQKSADLQVLPVDLPGQLSLLRKAALDVAVFSADLTAECNVVTRLALHRIAPLQVASNASCLTTGLPEIDLYLTGDGAMTEGLAAQFTERLGLLPGPTHTFNFEADREEVQVGCTRADFGLPAEAVVFVSTANFQKIIPEVQQVWARLLAAVPGSYLLVHPFAPRLPSNQTINHFYAAFEENMQRAGVDTARLVVSTVDFPSRNEVRGLLGLGDVYLDTFPFGGVDSLMDALELGLPIVAMEERALRSRTGASLLRVIGMGELIASTAAAYAAIAIKVAKDSAYRTSCRERICPGMGQPPAFLDTKATSEAFGTLLGMAYDELAIKGRELFRANLQPLRITGMSSAGR